MLLILFRNYISLERQKNDALRDIIGNIEYGIRMKMLKK